MPVRQVLRDSVQAVRDEVLLALQRRRRPSLIERNGIKIALDGTWATPFMRTVIYSGAYEEVELDLLRATLRPTDTYLEIGAGIGVLATAASSIVGDRRVTAVEANPEVAAVAARTCALNGFRPDIRTGVAVADAIDEPVAFYVAEQFWASSLAPQPGARRIDLARIGFAALLNETGATYLNMDVEGAETALLAAELPASLQRICVEVHPRVTGNDEITRMLHGLFRQQFVLDIERSAAGVVYLARD